MHDEYASQSADSEPSKNNARETIIEPYGPTPLVGRSKKAWDTYARRLNYLAASEEGFKDLA